MNRSKRYVIRDPEQLATVASPVRHQILRTMSAIGPCSIKELGGRLGRSPESLYYHVKALETVGLLFVKEKRVVGRRHEAIYDVIAKSILTDPTLASKDYIDAMKDTTSPLLRLADRQVQSALDHQRETGSQRHKALRIQQVNARLSKSAMNELNRRLDDVLQFVHENDQEDIDSMISVTLAVAPLLSKS